MRYQIIVPIAGIGLATVAVSCFVYYRIRRKFLSKLPENPTWELIGTVKELSIYPVRSAAALLINRGQCNKYGLSIQGFRDRSLVLLNDRGKAVFAGVYPTMLNITTQIETESIVVIRAPNKNPLKLNLDLIAQGKPIIERQCKGFKMRLIKCDNEQHEWFSELILKRPKGLFLYIALHPQLEYNVWGTDKSEFHSIMLMNNKSVDDLNSRLENKCQVHHLQFRGNILLECNENVKAYDENNWSWLKIGNASETSCILQYRAPCLRCILPNVDIKTCERNPHFEPLRTLKKYRLTHDFKAPTMGAYFKVYKEGDIQVNDFVYTLSSTQTKSAENLVT